MDQHFPVFEEKCVSTVTKEHASSTDDLHAEFVTFAKLTLKLENVPTAEACARAVGVHLLDSSRTDKFEKERVDKKLETVAKGAFLRCRTYKRVGAGKTEAAYLTCLKQDRRVDFKEKPRISRI